MWHLRSVAAVLVALSRPDQLGIHRHVPRNRVVLVRQPRAGAAGRRAEQHERQDGAQRS
jgi:hypothetical protein